MHLKRDIEYQSINGLNQMIKNVFRSQITKIMKTDVVTLNPGPWTRLPLRIDYYILMTLLLHQWRLSTWSQRQDKGPKSNPDGRWSICFFSKRNISIENERISISCPETEIHKKFTLLPVKTTTDILFFISERLQQRLMKFCQKSKSKDVTAASGHLLCKFFFKRFIFAWASATLKNAGCGVHIMKTKNSTLIIFNVFVQATK